MTLISFILAQLGLATLILLLSKLFDGKEQSPPGDPESGGPKLVTGIVKLATLKALSILAVIHLTVIAGHHILLATFGVSYSFQFWQHVNLGTLELAWLSRPIQLSLAVGLWAALPFLYLLIIRYIAAFPALDRARLRIIGTVSLISFASYAVILAKNHELPTRLFFNSARAALGANTTVRSLSAAEKQFLQRHGIAPLSDGQIHFTGLSSTPKARNLIAIYLEAFDLPYTNLDGNGFKELTPNLNALGERSTVFKNWYPADGYTIAALFGTHCGTKLDPGPTNGNAYLVEKFSLHSPLVCFTDILKEAGFKNVFMGGASTRFSGKGDFLLSHGYHQAIGRDWFENSNTLNKKFVDFGLLDFELFSEAAAKVKELHHEQQRFLFTILTLNTHQPGYPQSEACSPFPTEAGTDPLRKGAWCTDKAVGSFLQDLASAGVLDDTAVWIQSDHPQFQTELKRRALGDENLTNTRLVSMLTLPQQAQSEVIQQPTVGFDFPASALEVLGIKTNGRFQRGSSVFSQEFRERRAVMTDFGIVPKAARSGGEFRDCMPTNPLAQGTTFPPDWSDCTFALTNQLASLDQQHAHSRPSSITQTLRNLRFLVDGSGLPSITKITDQHSLNLLLYLQGSEYADPTAEAKPYALEISNSGEILNVRKLQHGQEPSCSSTDAFLQVTLVDYLVSLRQCAGNSVIKEFALEKDRTFQLPF